MRTLTASQIKRDLSGVTVTCLDRVYGVIDHNWLVGEYFHFWTRWLVRLGANYVEEAFDCDKYARAFQSNLHIAGFSAKSPHTVAGAMLVGDFPLHAWNLVFTDKGWHEVEPQTSAIKPLRKELTSLRYAIF